MRVPLVRGKLVAAASAVLVGAASAVLVVGGALPATAAPATTPGAPTSVKVTGAGGDADVSWGLPRTGAKVTGWTVQVTPAERQPNRGLDRLAASARSDHFGSLTAGTTYSFVVRAVGSRGTGPAVTVRHTASAPPTAAQALFALDSATGDVLRFPTSGTGSPVTVAHDGTGFTVDDQGDVFAPSADLTSIVMTPAGGGSARTVATGLHLTADLRSDVAGNLYWVDSTTGAVQQLSVTGGAARQWLAFAATTNTSWRKAWAVGADGTVSTWVGGFGGGVVTTATPNHTVTSRTLSTTAPNGYATIAGLVADAHGNLFLNQGSGGGGAAFWWTELPKGATSLVTVEPRYAYEYAATNGDTFSLLKSASWCAAISEAEGACTSDTNVPAMLVRAADGSTSSVPVTGLESSGRAPWVGASDRAGDVFVVAVNAAAPGLYRVPAAGGAAQRLSTTSTLSRLAVA